jgi:hypothetical protein
MRYAVVESGVVVNVVIANLSWVEFMEAEGHTIIPDPDQTASVGFTYSDGVFSPPEPQE